MPRIHRLDVQGFRGIRENVPLLFEGKSVLLFGENGTGKSSFVDALEKLFTRRVATLDGRAGGYDLTSLDTRSGELRLIEVKGIGGPTGTIGLTANEKRVAEDRRGCYSLYIVTHGDSEGRLQAIRDPAALPWHKVKGVNHYYLSVDAIRGAMRVRDETLLGERVP